MIRTASLYEACEDLFADYPLAARPVSDNGTVRSMVLMLRGDEEASFFVLRHERSDAGSRYSLRPWPVGDAVDIDIGADETAHVPDPAMNALIHGVPLPRHGSIFGWTPGDVITALIGILTDYEPDRPVPTWTVMPLAGLAESRWPPFTGRGFFGSWFWEDYRAGNITLLDDLIAKTHNTVFWVDTRAALGCDIYAVAHDIRSPEGHTLTRGCYMYSEALRAARPIPPLAEVLAGYPKTDLGPVFQ